MCVCVCVSVSAYMSVCAYINVRICFFAYMFVCVYLCDPNRGEWRLG
jgi:hypothetical protein